jgi:hypothetical protein
MDQVLTLNSTASLATMIDLCYKLKCLRTAVSAVLYSALNIVCQNAVEYTHATCKQVRCTHKRVLYIICLFNDVFNSSDHLASNERMVTS